MKLHRCAAALAGALTLIASASASAAGFMLTEQSAAGLGRAYAGAGVDGTDLSGVYYNPATMSLHRGTKAQAGGVGVMLDARLKANDGMEDNGRDGVEFVPHGYFLTQINDKMWFGLGITVPFGLATKYDEDFSASSMHQIGPNPNYNKENPGNTPPYVPYEGLSKGIKGIAASIQTVDVNPSLAWAINDKWTFGAGVSIQYVTADVTLDHLYAVGDSQVVVRSDTHVNDIAWGWNVGVMFKPTDALRFGLSYRSKVIHGADGSTTVSNPRNPIDNTAVQLPSAYVGNLSASTVVDAPAWAMATAAWDVNDMTSLYATVRWTDWSSYSHLVFTTPMGTLTDIQNDWKDTWLGSLGADFRVNDALTLRAGVAYETAAVDDPVYRTSIIPDADRLWLTIGSSYKFDKHFTIDLSAAYLRGVGERDLYGALDHKSYATFDKLDAYLLGAQLQYAF